MNTAERTWRMNITEAYLKGYLKKRIEEWYDRQGAVGRFEGIATVADNLDIVHSENGIKYRTRVVSYQYCESADVIYRYWESIVRRGICETEEDFMRNNYMGGQR